MGRRDGEVALLRRVPLLRPLTVPAIEELAVRAEAERFADGASVFAEGEIGEAFYVIAEGAAEVRQGGAAIRTLGPGDGFGEIALLRSCRRTASVVARGGLLVHAIEREAFLAAVTGHRPTAGVADEVVAGHLRRDERRTMEPSA
jgi:CRP-like cAMP-binding protein